MGDLYENLAGNTRRDLLAAFFNRLIVHGEEDGIHIRPIRTDVNEALHDWQANATSTNEKAPRVSAEGSSFSTIQRDNVSNGLSNNQLVDIVYLCSTNSATPVTAGQIDAVLGLTGDLSGEFKTRVKRPWTRLSDEQRAEVARRYETGETTTALAAAYGVAKSTIIGILREKRVVVRRQPLEPSQVSEAARLYKSGMSLSQVAGELKPNQETMRVAILRACVVLRPPTKAKSE